VAWSGVSVKPGRVCSVGDSPLTLRGLSFVCFKSSWEGVEQNVFLASLWMQACLKEHHHFSSAFWDRELENFEHSLLPFQ